MLESMTGFGSALLTITSDAGDSTQLTCFLKSINARYFEISFKLPHYLNYLERDFVNILRKQLVRGKVSCFMYCSDPIVFQGPIEPSLGTIKSYVDAAHRVKTECDVAGTLTISDLITLPNLFSSIEKVFDEPLKEKILTLMHDATAQLVASRQAEGQLLAHDIKQRCNLIQNDITNIEELAQQNFEIKREKTIQELNTLAQSKEADVIRHQLNYELNKTVITEELVRLTSHLKALYAILENNDQEKGRRIDFTLQELGREINTIASKSTDATISARTINIKVELEKIREQAQNIV